MTGLWCHIHMLLGAFLQDNPEALEELAALSTRQRREWTAHASSRAALNISPSQGSLASRSTAIKQYGFSELAAGPG